MMLDTFAALLILYRGQRH